MPSNNVYMKNHRRPLSIAHVTYFPRSNSWGFYRYDYMAKQVWVVGVELEPGVLSAGSSSFIVVDFFDFESQATPLLPGVSPAFDFATTFKVRAST